MTNVCYCLFGILVNHSITDEEFFHLLTIVVCLMDALILSRICLLMRPNSLFAGLINLQEGLFRKLSLWSFRVTNACRSAICSALSWMFISVAICCASWFIVWIMLPDAFLYDEEIEFKRSLSCRDFSIT